MTRFIGFESYLILLVVKFFTLLFFLLLSLSLPYLIFSLTLLPLFLSVSLSVSLYLPLRPFILLYFTVVDKRHFDSEYPGRNIVLVITGLQPTLETPKQNKKRETEGWVHPPGLRHWYTPEGLGRGRSRLLLSTPF